MIGLQALKGNKLIGLLGSLHPIHCTLFLSTWSLSIIGLRTTELTFNTFWFSFVFLFASGMGITCGYHRYWAHKSYEATNAFRWYLMLCGSAAFQGSCKWWSRGHRVHHRYTDTEKDPYSAHKGLLWSHIGWMIFKPDPANWVSIDISDLKNDPLVMFQHKWYLTLALTCSFLFPTLVCGLGWGDYQGGFFYAGVIRLVLLHNMTFSINSIAHYLGDQPFDDRLSPRDNLFTALITFGEGYHNFHHEFPRDYRNGIRLLDYDPSKWLIYVASLVGLTYDLHEFEKNEVEKGKYQMKVKNLAEKKKEIKWPPAPNSLPEMSHEEFSKVAKEKGLVIFNKLIHDVNKFIPDHPGGEKLVRAYLGKDVTAAFRGKVYEHSNGAENLLDMMRVARLKVD